MVSRPSENREQLKEQYIKLIKQETYSENLKKCNFIYKNLISQ